MLSTIEAVLLLFRLWEYLKEYSGKEYSDFFVKMFLNGLIIGKNNIIDLYDVYNTLEEIDKRHILSRRGDLERREPDVEELLKETSETKNILRIIKMKFFKKRLLNCFYANPDLKIFVDRDIKQIKYELSDGSHITIDNPSLLWECSCDVPQDYKNNRECELHKNENADKISKAFKKGLVEIIYDNVNIFWKSLKTLWPPSIDSLYFAKILKDECCYDLGRAKKILDIGAGTGFLGLYLFKNYNNIENVTFLDLFLTPLFSSLYNSFLNLDYNNFKKTNFVISSGLKNKEKIKKKFGRFDIIICAPPYLPSLGMENKLSDNVVSGTHLLRDIIINGGEICNKIIICYSSIATEEYEDSIKIAKKSWPNMEEELIEEKEVPFRVLHALENKDYMKKLLNEKKEYIIEKTDSPFKYWHKIKYYIIEYK